MTGAGSLDRGRAAFERQAWADAYAQLIAADCEAVLEPEDLERLAIAAHLVGRDAESTDIWARAHHGFLGRGAVPAAARCAFWLGFAIGIAEGALEDILTLSARKVPLLAHTSLATNPLFQHQLGGADAKLRAARGLLYADAAAAWGTAVAGAAFTPEHRARLRAATTWATATAASVVDMAYHAGGGSSIYSGNPLQRRFRDVHALTQHFLVKLDTLTTAGAVLAGAEADLTVF